MLQSTLKHALHMWDQKVRRWKMWEMFSHKKGPSLVQLRGILLFTIPKKNEAACYILHSHCVKIT